jgi:hypothetical protein
MKCRICKKETKEEICFNCVEFYKWKYQVKTIDEILDILEDQDRRNKNVEKTFQKKTKRGGGKK